MGTKKRKLWNAESINRALLHHESRGIIRSWSPPEYNGRSTWLIREYDGQTHEFNGPQTYAFVVGLAVAERSEYKSATP